MFDSLDEQMKHDEDAVTSKKEKALRWVAMLVIALLVFGGLYFGVRMLE